MASFGLLINPATTQMIRASPSSLEEGNYRVYSFLENAEPQSFHAHNMVLIVQAAGGPKRK